MAAGFLYDMIFCTAWIHVARRITTITGFVSGACTVQRGTGMLKIIAKRGNLLLNRLSESAAVLSRIAFSRDEVFYIDIFHLLKNLSFMYKRQNRVSK